MSDLKREFIAQEEARQAVIFALEDPERAMNLLGVVQCDVHVDGEPVDPKDVAEPIDYLIDAARTAGLEADDVSRILSVWQAVSEGLPTETDPVPYEVGADVLVKAYQAGVRSATTPERRHLLASLAEFRELVSGCGVRLDVGGVMQLDARPVDFGTWSVDITSRSRAADRQAVRLACAFHTVLEGPEAALHLARTKEETAP